MRKHSIGRDIIFFCTVILTAFVLAELEIQIEGAFGWAENLPVWRVSNKWTALIYGDRPLTGYHLHFNLLMLLLVHVPFLIGIGKWSLRKELVTLAFLILMWACEDFFWFVCNPAYGIAKFRPEFIPWHPHWFLGVPREYWLLFPVGIMFYIMSVMQKTLVSWAGKPSD